MDELRVQAEGCHIESRPQMLQRCRENWNMERSQGDYPLMRQGLVVYGIRRRRKERTWVRVPS